MHLRQFFLLLRRAICRFGATLLIISLGSTLGGCLDQEQAATAATAPDPQLIELGRQLFNDTALSSTGTQACSSCHAEANAFVDPDNTLPVSQGAESELFGTRNSPTAMYTAFVPPLHPEDDDGDVLWVGGLFVDGRVDSLEAQAGKPFFNPLEMNNADVAALVDRLRGSSTRPQFETVFGGDSLTNNPAGDSDEQQVLLLMTQAIAAFERTPAFAPFSSKFDAYLAGRATLDEQEAAGIAVFVRADKGNCAACHVMARGPNGEPPQFTDFTFDNLGVPRHPDRDFFTADFIDIGLEQTLLDKGVAPDEAAQLRGKFRVPTLRNIARTAPYMHNGVFTDLRTVIEFYNTRDTEPGRWAAIGETEVPATVNRDELGNLHLTDRDIDALAAFLSTLSDGYFTP